MDQKRKPKLAEWSIAVKKRDGKCMRCGTVEDLHAHHIKPKLTHPELKLDHSNGVTLCYRCHKKEHEDNRGTRIRSNRPHRLTLEKRSIELEKTIVALRKEVSRLERIIQTGKRGGKAATDGYCRYPDME